MEPPVIARLLLLSATANQFVNLPISLASTVVVVVLGLELVTILSGGERIRQLQTWALCAIVVQGQKAATKAGDKTRAQQCCYAYLLVRNTLPTMSDDNGDPGDRDKVKVRIKARKDGLTQITQSQMTR